MATTRTQNLEFIRTTEPSVVEEYGEFVPADGANPTSVTGCFATMTRTGEGKFSGTLKRAWRQFLFGSVQIVGVTGGSGNIETFNPQTKAITIGLYNAAGTADDQPTFSVRVLLKVKDTIITRR